MDEFPKMDQKICILEVRYDWSRWAHGTWLSQLSPPTSSQSFFDTSSCSPHRYNSEHYLYFSPSQNVSHACKKTITMTLDHLLHSMFGFILLAPNLASASKFSTNCTIPTESTTIVSPANIRGTFDILWSGLFTIFICIWTVQHLNVPEQRNGRDQGWRGDLKWAWKGFLIKLKWMGFTLMFPEFLVAKALADMITARKSMEKVKTLTCRDGAKLTQCVKK
jgi:hypothetical protein